jgi:hypothetical protein
MPVGVGGRKKKPGGAREAGNPQELLAALVVFSGFF